MHFYDSVISFSYEVLGGWDVRIDRGAGAVAEGGAGVCGARGRTSCLRVGREERVSPCGGEEAGRDGSAGSDLSRGAGRGGDGVCGVCAGDRGAVAGGWERGDYCGGA